MSDPGALLPSGTIVDVPIAPGPPGGVVYDYGILRADQRRILHCPTGRTDQAERAGEVIAAHLAGAPVGTQAAILVRAMANDGTTGAAYLYAMAEQAGHHPSYYTLATVLAIGAFFLGVAYAPWMASYTETVEARNPALIATGLAIWGWIIRVVIFIAFLIIPAVINSVTPLVNYGSTVSAYATQYQSEIAFAQSHPQIVATATTYKTQLANARKFAPELAVIQAHPALFAKLAAYPNPAAIPPKLAAQAVAAAGGGAQGTTILTTLAANGAAIQAVIAVAPKLAAVAPYAAQLTALSKVPPQVFPYLKAHGTAVQQAAAQEASQWKNWYWVCFAGIIVFLLSIPLLRGRWRPSRARQDEEEHEAMVAAELAKLSS